MHPRNGFRRRLVRGLALSLVVGTGLALSVALGSAATGGSAATTATTTTTTTTAKQAAPSNTSSPTISGSASDGSVLTANNGSWSNSPSAYAYQWLRCDAAGANCAPIAGAVAPTYVPGTADAGMRITVTVTATNSVSSKPATSAPTNPVSS